MEDTLEKIRQCCNNPKLFLFLFNGAGTADLPIMICKRCSQKPLFQKFTKLRISINCNSDVQEIKLEKNENLTQILAEAGITKGRETMN